MRILKDIICAALLFSLSLISMEPSEPTKKQEHPAFVWFNSPEAKRYYRRLADEHDLHVEISFQDEKQEQKRYSIALSKLKELGTFFKLMVEDSAPNANYVLNISRKTFKFIAYSNYLEREMGIINSASMFKEPLPKKVRKELLGSCDALKAESGSKALLFGRPLDFETLNINLRVIQTAIADQRLLKTDNNQFLKNKNAIETNQAIIFNELIQGDPLDENHKHMLATIRKANLQLLLPYPRGETLQFFKESSAGRKILLALLFDIFWDDLLYHKFGQKPRTLNELVSTFWQSVPYVDPKKVPPIRYTGTHFECTEACSAAKERLVEDLNNFLQALKHILGDLGIDVYDIQKSDNFTIKLCFDAYSPLLNQEPRAQLQSIYEIIQNINKEQNILSYKIFKKLYENIFLILMNEDDNEKIWSAIKQDALENLFIIPHSDSLLFLKNSEACRKIFLDLIPDIIWQHKLQQSTSLRRNIENIEKKIWEEMPNAVGYSPGARYRRNKFEIENSGSIQTKNVPIKLNMFRKILIQITNQLGVKIAFEKKKYSSGHLTIDVTLK